MMVCIVWEILWVGFLVLVVVIVMILMLLKLKVIKSRVVVILDYLLGRNLLWLMRLDVFVVGVVKIL